MATVRWPSKCYNRRELEAATLPLTVSPMLLLLLLLLLLLRQTDKQKRKGEQKNTRGQSIKALSCVQKNRRAA